MHVHHISISLEYFNIGGKMHITPYIKCKMHFPGGSVVKNPPAVWETWVGSLRWEDPLEKGMATLTPVFLPGKSQGRRSLADYSPWGCKESDTTERLSTISVFKHVNVWRFHSGFQKKKKCLFNRNRSLYSQIQHERLEHNLCLYWVGQNAHSGFPTWFYIKTQM